MAHGLNSALKRGAAVGGGCKAEGSKSGIGSRRIFAPHFKLQVLDSYRNDADCKGNQRATARKYGIHRRQIQKWLQVESNLRSSVGKEPEAALRSGRLRDAEEARVPALSPAAPLDFTTRRASPAPLSAPMDLSLKRPASPPPDVWDLSTKRKREEAPQASKPVKLFKPYLDDDDSGPKRQPPPCTACEATYYYNNNDVEYGAYTLHELQPKSQINYYYAYPAYPEYEMGPFYEDQSYVQGAALKQRHSYSLDFKLSAIECYYQDSVCKGNQRAVATKYNIHRRQVQKWLKQADELRQKNEIVKQTVR